MSTRENLSKRQFGYLRVIAPGPHQGRRTTWKCECACGTIAIVQTRYLLGGNTASCGCFRKKHGQSDSAEYRVWRHMIGRCHNPSDHSYGNYGGRGIIVCEEWRNSFRIFLRDVGARPSPKHSLDRINNDGPYAPNNVRWATKSEQLNNTRRTVRIEFDGRSQSVQQWARELGLPAKKLYLHARGQKERLHDLMADASARIRKAVREAAE